LHTAQPVTRFAHGDVGTRWMAWVMLFSSLVESTPSSE
jgi:hypothetical protein